MTRKCLAQGEVILIDFLELLVNHDVIENGCTFGDICSVG